MIDWILHLIDELGLLALIMWAGWDCLMYLSADKHGVAFNRHISKHHHLEHTVVSLLGVFAGGLAAIVFAIHLGVELSPNHNEEPIGGWLEWVEITAYAVALLNLKLISRHFRMESLEDKGEVYYRE